MNKKSVITLCLGLVLLTSACGGSNPSYAVGQVWSYETRPEEPDSTFTVVHVETLNWHGQDTIIVHISVNGLVIRGLEGNTITSISHLPFTEDALDRSVTELLETTSNLPDFQNGYDTWRKRFDSGESGVFDAPLAEVITSIIASFGQ